MLALLALSSIAGFMLVLVQNVRAQTTWNDLVHETIPKVVNAQETVDAAEGLLEGAAVAGVAKEETSNLEGLVDSSQALLEQLSEIALYVEPDVEDARDTLSDELEANPLAALDMFAESQKTERLQVKTPDNATAEIRRFEALSAALDDSLSSLEESVQDVQKIVGRHLDTAKQALATSQDSLRYEIVRGYVLDEFARGRDADEAARQALTDALQAGQQTLITQQGLDQTDAAVVAAAVVETNRAIADIKEAASALVELLGIDAQEVLDNLTPEQVWTEEEPWLPQPAPVAPPTTTPSAPSVPSVPDRPTVEEPDDGVEPGGDDDGDETGGEDPSPDPDVPAGAAAT